MNPSDDAALNSEQNSRGSIIERVVLAAGVGAFAGALHLWIDGWSFRGFFAGAAAGASFFAVLALAPQYLAKKDLRRVVISAVAGGIAGLTWSVISGTDVGMFGPVLAGVVVGVILIWWELSP